MPTIIQKEPYEFQLQNLARNEAIWLQVKNFSLQIKRTDEGLVVDIFDAVETEQEESLASTYAFDSETALYQEEET